MESVSRSSEDEDDFVRRQGSSLQGELTVRVDGKNGDNKLGTPTTPRSKHSATEQRRRCKINERFQILRDLIPHSDQKRDRATFLLEVIEYVKFLQEKVQKFEAAYPECYPDNAKLTPWSSNRLSGEGMSDMSQVVRNGNSSGYTFSGKFSDNNTLPVTPNAILGNSHVVEPELPTEILTVNTQSQPTWQRQAGPSDCNVNTNLLPEQDELAIDEGTITVSSIYSQNLFGALTNAMESSGIDLSQASVTVQVNLGKRASSRRMPSINSNSKDHNVLSHGNQMMDASSDQVSKRHKLNKC
ncbi:basic helix-loop-helix (bHLH) DNA-binding superfamily protein [Rhynchospora pubera]|uniref:Basic helix-loop-helix (BHLH) DNA-binding superfamily protein n=1 Tax=Rhynchospora pubera TaxID=906938 RepID=A0AAV8E2B0_9POAL|nr:basic helix-loop-helix (bHLH) DNA-binding superfamily protein [Rhynchospora pubera]KAJ4785721.1 basic helix-loop-helix (bHLH) DNA-binding superfamily protein [Rhynchospora pubera]